MKTYKQKKYINNYSDKCDIIVFPEMVLTGYPPQDLLLESRFIQIASTELETISEKVKNCVVVLGTIRKEEDNLFNSAAILSQGQDIEFRDKTLLPTYDVFEEDRYFTSSINIEPLEIKINDSIVKLGIHICEDLWNQQNDIDVIGELAKNNSDIEKALRLFYLRNIPRFSKELQKHFISK